MAISLHVNGEASIWLGTGASAALEELGVSVDGVDITFNMTSEEVFVDTYGATPYDVQYFPDNALITAELVLYDQTVLNKALARFPAGTAGTANTAGTLFVAQGKAYRVLIKSVNSGTSEACHNFPTAFLNNATSVKVGTRKSIYKVEFRALNSQQTGDSSGAVLYNSTCS